MENHILLKILEELKDMKSSLINIERKVAQLNYIVSKEVYEDLSRLEARIEN